MKDVGDKIRREHHLDTLGLEITETRKWSGMPPYAGCDLDSLCRFTGVSLVTGLSPDVRHSQRHGIGGLEQEDIFKKEKRREKRRYFYLSSYILQFDPVFW